jgi:hypothetical protein
VDAATGGLKSWKPDPNATKDSLKTSPVAPLLNATVSSKAKHNVFANQKPVFMLNARNWQAQTAKGKLDWKMMDGLGKTLKQGTKELSVEDIETVALTSRCAGIRRLPS